MNTVIHSLCIETQCQDPLVLSTHAHQPVKSETAAAFERELKAQLDPPRLTASTQQTAASLTHHFFCLLKKSSSDKRNDGTGVRVCVCLCRHVYVHG